MEAVAKRLSVAAVSLSVLGVAGAASAVPAFDAGPSYIEYIHDPDKTPGDGIPTSSLTLDTPTTSAPTSPYQFSRTHTLNSTHNSVAKASAGHTTNATTAAVKIAAGTGVTQTNPAAGTRYAERSELRINVNMYWDITGDNTFGPPASGLSSFTVGGKVGAGGFARFAAQLDFLDPDYFGEISLTQNTESSFLAAAVDPGAYRSRISFDRTFVRADADVADSDGLFSKTFSSTELLQSPDNRLYAGQRLWVTGFIIFQAKNDEEPTSIELLREGGVAGAIDDTNIFGVPEPMSAASAVLALSAAGLAASRRRA